jgi:hypothetical protein
MARPLTYPALPATWRYYDYSGTPIAYGPGTAYPVAMSYADCIELYWKAAKVLIEGAATVSDGISFSTTTTGTCDGTGATNQFARWRKYDILGGTHGSITNADYRYPEEYLSTLITPISSTIKTRTAYHGRTQFTPGTNADVISVAGPYHEFDLKVYIFQEPDFVIDPQIVRVGDDWYPYIEVSGVVTTDPTDPEIPSSWLTVMCSSNQSIITDERGPGSGFVSVGNFDLFGHTVPIYADVYEGGNLSVFSGSISVEQAFEFDPPT